MLRNDLCELISASIDSLIGTEDFPNTAHRGVEITDSKSPEHGDFACNYALVATKSIGKPPRFVAELLRDALLAQNSPLVSEIDIAGPGFLNIRLSPTALGAYVQWVLTTGTAFSRPVKSRTQRINVEFVSVNPNGPVTVGSGRGAAFGETLCRVLIAAGNEVHREYYYNDGVNSEQMRMFAESVRSYVQQLPFPEKGYRGDYVQDVAARLMHAPPDANVDWFQEASQAMMLEKQKEDLLAFRVRFDTWYGEQSLHTSGEVKRCLDELEQKGVADTKPYRRVIKFGKGGVVNEVVDEPQTDSSKEDDEDDGDAAPTVDDVVAPTLWLRSTKFGDDMDRVLRRRDGRLTYISSDVAYHKDKFQRPANADKLITILGPDHHGYIGRLHAVLAALLRSGADTEENNRAALELAREKLEVLIFQIVRFVKDGKPAPMRKRDGNIYALIDLIKEIGVNAAPHASSTEQAEIGADVARFFYLMRSHDTHMDFDIDLATKQNDENPVFYVQYAHARICSVLDKAAEAGLRAAAEPQVEHVREIALLKKILDLPNEVERAAQDYGVHRLATYAVELARSYHHFYDACRVVDAEEPETSQSRICLCEAARIALQSVCGLLGVRTPERLERAESSVS